MINKVSIVFYVELKDSPNYILSNAGKVIKKSNWKEIGIYNNLIRITVNGKLKRFSYSKLINMYISLGFPISTELIGSYFKPENIVRTKGEFLGRRNNLKKGRVKDNIAGGDPTLSTRKKLQFILSEIREYRKNGKRDVPANLSEVNEKEWKTFTDEHYPGLVNPFFDSNVLNRSLTISGRK